LKPLLVIVGPTGSGKTALAAELAERVGGEVVSADSVQVVRRFDVGSGKPTAEELGRAPHHLLDVVDPLEPMDAARWAQLADAAISDIRARGRTPIVCGGTFLWVRALLFGLAEAPPADDALRDEYRALAEHGGREAVHQRLAAVDPASAERLNPNDFVRVSRALEVFELTGVPLSRWQAQHGFAKPRHAARLVGIDWPREELDARLLARTRAMMAAGFVEEVRGLLADGYGAARAMRSVGYRQIAEALSSDAPLDESELEQRIYRATRVFVRRQRTWLRDEPVEWLAPGTLPDV
jgi:tRNA dimethylallyltransferase